MKLILLAVLFTLASSGIIPDSVAEESTFEDSVSADSSSSYSKQYPPRAYKFGYAVRDEKSYNDYSHQQESDGKVTTGSYRVLLPDGRTQIVTYRADEHGYVADVKYEGTAKYPEYRPSFKSPAEPKSYGTASAFQQHSTSFQQQPSHNNPPTAFAPPYVKSTIISQLEEPSFVRQQQSAFIREPSPTFLEISSSHQSREGSAASDSTVAATQQVVSTAAPVTVPIAKASSKITEDSAVLSANTSKVDGSAAQATATSSNNVPAA